MANGELMVEIAAKLTIPDETVKRCMALLEMWMDDNPGKIIVCDIVPCKDMMRRRLHIEQLRQEVTNG